jgi:hypothetical protein
VGCWRWHEDAGHFFLIDNACFYQQRPLHGRCICQTCHIVHYKSPNIGVTEKKRIGQDSNTSRPKWSTTCWETREVPWPVMNFEDTFNQQICSRKINTYMHKWHMDIRGKTSSPWGTKRNVCGPTGLCKFHMSNLGTMSSLEPLQIYITLEHIVNQDQQSWDISISVPLGNQVALSNLRSNLHKTW